MTTHPASPCPANQSESTRTSIGARALGVCALAIATVGLLLATATAHAQTTPTVFIANLDAGTISTYTTSGTLLNASFITGLNGPTNIAISGSDLYVSNSSNSTIGKYTIVSGTTSAVQNASFITNTNGLNNPRGLVVSGSNLFVANLGTGVIQNYATSGSFVSNVVTVPGAHAAGLTGLALSGTTLIEASTFGQTIGSFSTSGTSGFTTSTNPSSPAALAISGGAVYLSLNQNGGGGVDSIKSYNVINGTIINSNVVPTGLSSPTGLAAFNDKIFVANYSNSNSGAIGVYDINLSSYSTLVSGLSGGTYGIAVANVSAIPEPSTYAAMAGVAALGLALWNKRRNKIAVVTE